MDRDVVYVQEKQGDSYASFAFDLTYRDFYNGVQERAEPLRKYGFHVLDMKGKQNDTLQIYHTSDSVSSLWINSVSGLWINHLAAM